MASNIKHRKKDMPILTRHWSSYNGKPCPI